MPNAPDTAMMLTPRVNGAFAVPVRGSRRAHPTVLVTRGARVMDDDRGETYK